MLSFFLRLRIAPRARRRSTRFLAFERLEERCLLTTFNVLNTNDSGGGSLRKAIDDANDNPDDDKILFAAALSGQTININTSLPQITDSVKIQNKNAQSVTVDGQDTAGVRPFDIAAGAAVTLKKLTITGGNANEIFVGGGGILNGGELALNNCIVTRNQSTGGSASGGGIGNLDTGTLTIKNSTVSNNQSVEAGGGIRNDGEMTLTAVRVKGNVAAGHGGGIVNVTSTATATIKDSTIAGNIAGFDGGGIVNLSSASLTVERSSIYGNRANRSGGGFEANSGDATFLNTTIAHNLSNTGEGGGIALFNDADATLVNCTVADNADMSNLAESAGGVAKPGNGMLIVRNSIIAENSAGPDSATDNVDFAGLDENTNNNLGGGTGLQLSPLQDNGGPTLTMAPMKGSAVIDAGSNAAANNAGLTTDQRGLTRIVGGTVDIGAVETQAGEPLLLRAGGAKHGPKQQFEALTTFKVTDKGDAPGTPGTLRDAIEQANANPGADVITFGKKVKGKSIKLQDSLPQITEDLTINGPVTVDGQGTAGIRPFDIAATANVTFNMLTVTGGHIDAAVNGTKDGGGILNRGGTLTLVQCVVTANEISGAGSGSGGGIANFPGGTLTLDNSTVSNNLISPSGSGGGIDNDDATLILTNAKVIGNRAPLISGVANAGASSVVTIDDSTIAANLTLGACGGIGIFDGDLTVRESTISGNRATTGGGVIVFGGTAKLLNCTIAYNVSGAREFTSSDGGGGILQTGGDLTIVNSTIVGNADAANEAEGAGGIAKTNGTLSLSNTVIAGNFAGPGSVAENVDPGDINASGNNFIDGDPRLGPLQNNGGPTFTIAPLAGSPLIDAGSNFLATSAGLTTDQRGLTRIVDGTVDIGAVETQVGEPLPIRRATGGSPASARADKQPVAHTFDIDLAFAAAVVKQDRGTKRDLTALFAAFAAFGNTQY